jgi:hypothetical protein
MAEGEAESQLTSNTGWHAEVRVDRRMPPIGVAVREPAEVRAGGAGGLGAIPGPRGGQPGLPGLRPNGIRAVGEVSRYDATRRWAPRAFRLWPVGWNRPAVRVDDAPCV